MTIARVEIPPKLVPLFARPRGSLRYRGAYGGRGSAKSFTFAKMCAIWGYSERLRILCTRELQDSIKESFHTELKRAIESEQWLAAHYDVGIDYLRGRNGTEFIFKGLRHNIGSIKSTAGIDLCIVEEAEDVPEHSWEALEPTIRAPGSEIWVIWNPKRKGSPVDTRLRLNPPPRSLVVPMNYHDNPWFPPELEEKRIHDRRVMLPEKYAHIWEGEYLENSDAQIFRNKWRVDSFEPGKKWDGPYFGLDFGFSQDPTAAVKCWINDRKLMIEKECGGIGVELDDTAKMILSAMPEAAKHVMRGDSSRPESISHIKRKGIPQLTAAQKGKGSVEDGIEFIRSFDEVVIHPSCEQCATEFRLYSYKTDRHTGDVLTDIVDDNNHYIDALRYALEPAMRKTIYSLDNVL